MTRPGGGGDAAPVPSPGGSGDEPDADLRETEVGSQLLHEGRYLSLRLATIERADGTRATREIVGHPGAVAMLALDGDGRVLMVRQWRAAAGRAMLEIPAGTLDRDDDGTVEAHDLAARRELEEETGYRARTWRHLASFWTAPGFAEELMHLYLATDLVPAHDDRLGPDDDERLELERVPWRDALRLALEGGVVDAKSILGLLWLAHLRQGSGEAPLQLSGEAPLQRSGEAPG